MIILIVWKPLNLGYYDLNLFSKCTIGLWGGDGNSGSSYSENRSTDTNKKGVYFNKGAYILTKDEFLKYTFDGDLYVYN